MISYEQAIDISKCFATEISRKYGDNIIAVYVTGSLGSDYYRPGQSDIDTIIIVKVPRSEITELSRQIESIADRYMKDYDVPKGFGAIVISEEQLYPPYIVNEEIVPELLRLKMQSKIIFGGYDLSSIPLPDKQAIIDAENAFEDWRETEFTVAENMTRTMTINSILLLLKRYLLIACDVIEFNKFKVIDKYLQYNPPFVNEEVFNLINGGLHNGIDVISDEQLLMMSKWHQQVLLQMNKLLLGR